MYNFTRLISTGLGCLSVAQTFVEKWHQLAIDISMHMQISLHVSIIFVLPLEEPPSSRDCVAVKKD